ncbi:MAG: hypothetical protein ACF8OB_03280 [Phycisphaeraceae bacterium JB051]
MPTVKTAKRPTVTGHEMLSRYVTNKPKQLKTKICKAMNAGGVVWRHQDHPTIDSPDICTWDGLSFLGNGKAKTAWETLWQGSDAPCLKWDAIGRVQIGTVGWNWLLVSAMTHVDEMLPQASKRLPHISPAMVTHLSNAKRKFKVQDNVDWPASSQYVQQLAALAFLREHGVCVQMLNITFLGLPETGTGCSDGTTWKKAIISSFDTLGLSCNTPVWNRTHRLMLPVI